MNDVGRAAGAPRMPAGYRWVATLSQDPARTAYRATDERNGQQVVVEVYPGDPGLRTRLARETAQAAALHHPYVIPVLDVGDLDGAVYTVSPFVDGPDLGTRLESGPLPTASVVTVLGPVADALDLAHRSGLTHRGLGPRAIVLAAPNDVPCLRGFGVAAEIGSGGDDPAPEQLRGAAAVPRTDVYALGALLFRCLTGRAPVGRGDAPPRVSEVRPDLPRDLDDVVARAMAREPDRRTETCRSVVDATAAILGRETPAAPPEGATVQVPRPAAAPVAAPTLIGPAPYGAVPPGGAQQGSAQQRGAQPGAGTPGSYAPAGYGQFPPGPYGAPEPAAAAPKRRRRRTGLIVALLAVVAIAVAAVIVVPRIIAAGRPTSDELARVPVALRSDCSVGEASAGAAGATRVLVCKDPAAAQEVTTSLFATPDAADTAYRAVAAAAPDAKAGAGDCADGPGVESTYPGVGAQAGRVFCVRDGSAVRMGWLDRADRTVSSTVRSDGNALELYRAWSGWAQVPAYPAAEEQKLLAYLEDPHCRRAKAGSLERLDGLVSAVDCTPSGTGADTESYYLFSDAESLRRAFADDVTAAGSPPDTFCGNAESGQAAGNSEYGSPAVAGRVLCNTTGAKPTMSWTTDALFVLGRAGGSDLVALKTYWKADSGPTLAARLKAINAAATPPFPTSAESALLRHIPTDVRENCVRSSPTAAKNLGGDRASATISCLGLGGATLVVYVQLPDAGALVAAVGRPVTGPDCQTLPSNFNGISTYARAGATGILDCGTPTDKTLSPFIDWTKDGDNIFVYAYGPTAAGLISWWQSGVAGPV